MQILAPSNDAFNKIPYSSLSSAFQDNDEDVITNVLEYHILQGTRLASQLVPGTPEFIPTLLTSQEYTNVSGGQVVENVEQAGDVVVFVSGLGTRSTLTTAVSPVPSRTWEVSQIANLLPTGSPVHRWRGPSHRLPHNSAKQPH